MQLKTTVQIGRSRNRPNTKVVVDKITSYSPPPITSVSQTNRLKTKLNGLHKINRIKFRRMKKLKGLRTIGCLPV